jgi:hypothetical protein
LKTLSIVGLPHLNSKEKHVAFVSSIVAAAAATGKDIRILFSNNEVARLEKGTTDEFEEKVTV